MVVDVGVGVTCHVACDTYLLLHAHVWDFFSLLAKKIHVSTNLWKLSMHEKEICALFVKVVLVASSMGLGQGWAGVRQGSG